MATVHMVITMDCLPDGRAFTTDVPLDTDEMLRAFYLAMAQVVTHKAEAVGKHEPFQGAGPGEWWTGEDAVGVDRPNRRADWRLLQALDLFTQGKLRGAVHDAGHDFAPGAEVRYTADLTDFADLTSVYRVRAWFGEELLYDSGEPNVTYARIDWREGEWDPGWLTDHERTILGT